MRAEHHRRAFGYLGKILDEHRPFGAKVVHYIFVVHDLVAHVDRRSVQLECAFDDLDRAVYAGAKTAGIGEQDFHGVNRLIDAGIIRRGIASSDCRQLL